MPVQPPPRPTAWTGADQGSLSDWLAEGNVGRDGGATLTKGRRRLCMDRRGRRSGRAHRPQMAPCTCTMVVRALYRPKITPSLCSDSIWLYRFYIPKQLAATIALGLRFFNPAPQGFRPAKA